MSLVETMVNMIHPNFNDEKAGVATYSNGDDTYLEYYNKDRKLYRNGHPETFALYYVWRKELMLNRDLFLTLEDYFGEDNMTLVIDWFNKEFDQDAESVTF